MKIISLETENTKRIRAVTIKPTGDLIILGGKNGQGKTSVLDSIEMALGGGAKIPEVPVRRGATRSVTTVDLGQIMVRRTITADGGGSLVVTNAEGAVQKSPQTLLDAITGKLTFDPLAFARMEPTKQGETLRQVSGLDLTALTDASNKTYSQRTEVNRKVAQLEAQLKSMPHHEGVPEKEQSPAELTKRYEDGMAQNRQNAVLRGTAKDALLVVKNLEDEVNYRKMTMQNFEEQIKELQAKVDEARQKMEAAQARAEEARVDANAKAAAAAGLVDITTFPISNEIVELERTNNKVRQNLRRAEVVKELAAVKDQAAKLTRDLENIDEDRRQKIAAVALPIPGLGFDEMGRVTFNGLPFAQASDADKLKVSVGIGMALNPKLRVLLIRNGSLLDAESLALIAKLAEEKDCQVWLEKVSDDGEGCTVVIEDGMVRHEQEPTPEPASTETL